MEHTKHIWRAVLILIVLLVAFIVVRHFLIPESFGREGFYRHDSIREFMAKEPRHGTKGSCAKCHEKEAKESAGAGHANVSCEVCHAPGSLHAKGGDKVAEMPSDGSVTMCSYCHRKLLARPKAYTKVVDIKEHLDEVDAEYTGEIPAGICLTCHGTHNPETQ